MERAQVDGDADDAFEMVARPRRPGAPAPAPTGLAVKPLRPSEYQVRWLSCCYWMVCQACLPMKGQCWSRFEQGSE